MAEVLTGTFWRIAAAFLVVAAPMLIQADDPTSLYTGSTSVFIPYSNAAHNHELHESPKIHVGFDNKNSYHAFTMDTGSVGIIASADIFQPAPGAINLGPGRQIYTSTGIIEEGTWWTSTQKIYDHKGNLLAITQAPVLQVTHVSCTENARSCRPRPHPRGIAMMGMGFARESKQQEHGTPAYNPFLNVQAIRFQGALQTLPADWCNGYIVTPRGIELGLTATNTRNAGFVKLQRAPQFSTASLQEWLPAPMTLNINGISGDGHVLMDTGVDTAYMTPPPGAQLGALIKCPKSNLVQCAPPGNVITIYLPNQANPVASYTFTTGYGDYPMAPSSVHVVHGPKIFLNTSRHWLKGMNLIYDNTHGYVGYQNNRGQE
jgi:hypothetical protein